MEKQEVGKYLGGQMSIPDMRTLAADFAKSGYFTDAREAAQAVVKIQAGIEMGFGPVYSMTKIYIVKGKVMLSAEALGAMVKRSGRYDYTIKSLTDTECVLEFTDQERVVYTSKFNMEDAKRADLIKQDGGWNKWPRAMLISKAISQGARIVCPHVIAGVYTPADFAVETSEDGEPIKGEVVDPVPEPKAVEMITEPQRKKIFATAKEKGVSEEPLKQEIWDQYAHPHIAELTKGEASQLIEALTKLPAIAPQTDEKPPVKEKQTPTTDELWKGRQVDPAVVADIKELAKDAKWNDVLLKEYCASKGWQAKKLTELTAGQAAELHKNLQDIAFTLA